MDPTNTLFGTYSPQPSPIHRLPLKAKGLFLFLLTLLLALTDHWPVSLLALLAVLGIGRLAGIPARTWWLSLRQLAFLLILLTAYYPITGKLATGADIIFTLLTMLFASRVLLWSTPVPVIIDGFIWLCSPLRLLGLNPDKIGLALALMIRSIPVVMDNWQALRMATIARGIRVSPYRLSIPLVIATVAYAQESGDALAARGLDS